MYEEAKQQLQTLWLSDSAYSKYIPITEEVYKKNGIEALFRWATEVEEKVNSRDAYVIAENYVLLGENELALKWLEKAYETQSNSLPKINSNVHFDNLRSNPRFIEVLDKMNLRD